MQFGLIVANQNKKTRIKTSNILKRLYTNIQGAPRKKQYHCSFRGAPKIFCKNDFCRSVLSETWQKKQKQKRKEKVK